MYPIAFTQFYSFIFRTLMNLEFISSYDVCDKNLNISIKVDNTLASNLLDYLSIPHYSETLCIFSRTGVSPFVSLFFTELFLFSSTNIILIFQIWLSSFPWAIFTVLFCQNLPESGLFYCFKLSTMIIAWKCGAKCDKTST